jgi:pyrimidine operon attenuation protein / uracil phosphoribosyltransferase
MENARTLILGAEQIEWKLQRMAYQIWEQNVDQKELTIIGIADNGLVLAQNIAEKLRKISSLNISIIKLAFNKMEPLTDLPDIAEDLNGKSVVIIDDVANSGKVLLYALRPVMQYIPSKIIMAVLVDRKHKSYPIYPDIVGQSLSTTLQENIRCESDGTTIKAVYLD